MKMLNKYQKHKEKLWKEARERYWNLSEEEKGKMRKKALERMKKKQKASVLTGTKPETTSVKKKLMFNTYLVITHMCYY